MSPDNVFTTMEHDRRMEHAYSLAWRLQLLADEVDKLGAQAREVSLMMNGAATALREMK